MKSVGVRELRQHASNYLEEVAGGVPIEITDRGPPVARLVPVASDPWEGLVDAGEVVKAGHQLNVGDLEPAAYSLSSSEALDAVSRSRFRDRHGVATLTSINRFTCAACKHEDVFARRPYVTVTKRGRVAREAHRRTSGTGGCGGGVLPVDAQFWEHYKVSHARVDVARLYSQPGYALQSGDSATRFT